MWSVIDREQQKCQSEVQEEDNSLTQQGSKIESSKQVKLACSKEVEGIPTSKKEEAMPQHDKELRTSIRSTGGRQWTTNETKNKWEEREQQMSCMEL